MKKTEETKKSVKKAAKAPVAEDAPSWTPVLGEKVEHDGNIIAITSFDPLEATVYRREGGVQTFNPYPLDSLEGVTPVDIQEVYRRIH